MPSEKSTRSEQPAAGTPAAAPGDAIEWLREEPFPSDVAAVSAVMFGFPFYLPLIVLAFHPTLQVLGGVAVFMVGCGIWMRKLLFGAVDACRGLKIGMDWNRRVIVARYGQNVFGRDGHPDGVIPFTAVRSVVVQTLPGAPTTVVTTGRLDDDAIFNSYTDDVVVGRVRRSYGVSASRSWSLSSPGPEITPPGGHYVIRANLHPDWPEPPEMKGFDPDGTPWSKITEVVFAVTDDRAEAEAMATALRKELALRDDIQGDGAADAGEVSG